MRAPTVPSETAAVRERAHERFRELGFPTTKDEDWRFTNVAPIAGTEWNRPTAAGDDAATRAGLTAEKAARLALGGQPAAPLRVVFVNGRYAPELSALANGSLPRGVKLGSLAAAIEEEPELVLPHLARYASFEKEAFVAFNTASIEDGAFLHLSRGTVVERPIQVLFVTTASGDGPTAAHPRNLFVAGPEAQATIVEHYVALEDGGGAYFTNAVTEVVLGESAVLEHVKLEREAPAAYHVATTQVHQDRASSYTSHSISLGGALVRNDVNAVLAAEGAECTLNGLYVAAGKRHVDNHTLIDHAKPHCASRELYKGVLAGAAHAVFNGKVVVRKDAQKTDAKQTNKNLLLSGDAVVDTKPQLEIFANDVKCTHGATIGQIDRDQLFYLRARGIGPHEARRLLTYAFTRDVVSRVKAEDLRNALDELVHGRLPTEPGAA